MEKHKIYCDECIFLERRPTIAEKPLDSGNYIITGSRFHCKKHNKWWAINTTNEQVGYSSCVYGKRRE